jgi:hypothetical protein
MSTSLTSSLKMEAIKCSKMLVLQITLHHIPDFDILSNHHHGTQVNSSLLVTLCFLVLHVTAEKLCYKGNVYVWFNYNWMLQKKIFCISSEVVGRFPVKSDKRVDSEFLDKRTGAFLLARVLWLVFGPRTWIVSSRAAQNLHFLSFRTRSHRNTTFSEYTIFFPRSAHIQRIIFVFQRKICCYCFPS